MSKPTFEEFSAKVKESCTSFAKRKNYSAGEINSDDQPLLVFAKAIGINQAHAVGEIVWKCAELMKTPKRVIVEKMAGWCWIIWRDLPPEE